MKKIWVLCIPVALLIAGCATTKQVNNLETRLDTLESKVNSMEPKEVTLESPLSKIENIYTDTESYTAPSESKSKPAVCFMSKKDIQTALKNAGYYDGAIDGQIGKNTRKAIREFQKANGLQVDGIAGSKTKELLANYLTQ